MENEVLIAQKMFLNEAMSSPLLFSDLANIEGYISESYSGRSLIELIQNADDAGSTFILIKILNNNSFIVANNGRPFTKDDFYALCRSGSSTKKRKSSTIGFRGIGFKSIVNYSAKVHLISGAIQATYSREKTKELLPEANKVPLIRIPHLFDGYCYQEEISKLLSSGYTTIFIFETSNTSIEEEIVNIAGSNMLFVNNINRVIIETDKLREILFTRVQKRDCLYEICVTEEPTTQKWLIVKNANNKRSSIAFKLNGHKVIDADIEESVIHSFMPTRDRLSVKMKINGDFSTDPSRTRVVWDEESKETLSGIVEIISSIFSFVYNSGTDDYGFIDVLKAIRQDPMWQLKGMTPNDHFAQATLEAIKNIIDKTSYSKSIYLQPEQMDSDDFEQLTECLKVVGIGKNINLKIPGILELYKSLGYKTMPLEKVLEAMKNVNCTERTKAAVFADTVRWSVNMLSDEQCELIKHAQIIKSDKGYTRISDMPSDDKLTDSFMGMVLDLSVNPIDLSSFAKKMNISYPTDTNISVYSNNKTSLPTVLTFKKDAVLHKWRSAEKIAISVLESFPFVSTVEDLSKQNVGYDLEVVLKNGAKRYYEVKSVTRLGEEFSFTNNEYSTASEYKDKYYFAIVCQTAKEISVCFIANPINTLEFTKRAVRWEWVCHEYAGEVVIASLK